MTTTYQTLNNSNYMSIMSRSRSLFVFVSDSRLKQEPQPQLAMVDIIDSKDTGVLVDLDLIATCQDPTPVMRKLYPVIGLTTSFTQVQPRSAESFYPPSWLDPS